MKNLEIFDPAMCCSTGVCGTSIDPELMRIATVINNLKENGIEIKRHGLTNEPQDFVNNEIISRLLEKDGAEILPVTFLNGEVVKTKEYPTNKELEKWLETTIANKKSDSKCCCGDGKCC